ncbi:tripartite tricarboxylate transporter TctB family protein [Kocuria flava]|uniref:tripartite tricarboxylate transporter TctB family protein n=1 Tax=Kocuria flava TaxID=446860 RepID=UPI001FF38A0D|nr:tripartite tricarboxylate transporter TctB family protein [Kocuria flava]MCJ8503936.1 tripartite tricarboxylate transporter TctB family protein [Kocuria flava]
MSTSTSSPTGTAGEHPAPAQPPRRTPDGPPSPSSWWAGRSGLVVPAVTAGFSTYLLAGALTMEIPEGTDFPGPAFYPLLLVVAGYVLSALLALHYLRTPEHPAELSERSWRTHSDWAAVAWGAGGFLVFALTLELLGWILAAALLFWAVARGFGSRRPLFDLVLALFVSSAIYLAFAVGLDLTLPSGILGGGF